MLLVFFPLPKLWIIDYQPTVIFSFKKNYLMSRMSQGQSHWNLKNCLHWEPHYLCSGLYILGGKSPPFFPPPPRGGHGRTRPLTPCDRAFCEKERRCISNVDERPIQTYTCVMPPGPQGNVLSPFERSHTLQMREYWLNHILLHWIINCCSARLTARQYQGVLSFQT